MTDAASLGMRIGERYVVTRDSKNREFQAGDRVWMEDDGAIMNATAHGWMEPEDVAEATAGWAIEPAKERTDAKPEA